MCAPFARGLSRAFLSDLLDGASAPVLAACRDAGLDVRLRDDYWNAYDFGRSVAKVAWVSGAPRLEVHRAYLDLAAFPRVSRALSGDYVHLPVHALARQFASELPRLRQHAAAHVKTEEKDELRLMRDNTGDAPVVAVDRQVQVPGTRRTLDVVGVTTTGTPTLVLVELKRDLDSRIQEVPVQLAGYLAVFRRAGGGLRADIATSLALVAAQLTELGFRAPRPDRFHAGMPLAGLVVLVRYNTRSELLARAHVAARGLTHPIHLWMPLDDQALRIPHPRATKAARPGAASHSSIAPGDAFGPRQPQC